MLGPQVGGVAIAMQASITLVMHHPLGVFSLLVAISAAVPPLIRRVGLPDLVGLLAAGVVVGPHAINLVDSSSETVRLLSDLGAVYLLFTMGLEIDLEEFNRVKRRSFIYGLLILLIGVGTGVSIGLMAGFASVSCLLLGALMATHTPLGYPIVRSYGAQKDESVVVSLGQHDSHRYRGAAAAGSGSGAWPRQPQWHRPEPAAAQDRWLRSRGGDRHPLAGPAPCAAGHQR